MLRVIMVDMAVRMLVLATLADEATVVMVLVVVMVLIDGERVGGAGAK